MIRLRDEAPTVGVLTGLIAAVFVVEFASWQAGLALLGGVLLVAAGLRLMLPEVRLGWLSVRSRTFDVVLLTVLGAALLVATVSLATHP